MKRWNQYDRSTVKSLAAASMSVLLMSACGGSDHSTDQAFAAVPDARLLADGQAVFRFDTFGDELHWTDTLRMHEVIRSAVDPTTALAIGLKVDADALPASVAQGIRDGSVDLNSPATTVALLKLNAVVGLQGKVEVVDGKDTLTRVGITCALCHSTVDNSFAPGIGKKAGRLGEPRFKCRGNHCLVACLECDHESRLQFLGERQVRPALQSGRRERPASDSSRIRT